MNVYTRGLLVVAVVSWAGCSLDPLVGGACLPGLEYCDGQCIDPQADDLNCGACGHVCTEGGSCARGQCTGGGCEAPEVWCDGAACANLWSDPDHCGDCNIACASDERCASGQCVGRCPPDLLECESACVDASSDPNNCGACGEACEAGLVCSEGSCAADCPPGTQECSRTCVDTSSDPEHCGGCGVACGADGVCAQGTCVTCASNEVPCDNACVDTSSDSDHCGACGASCDALEECQASTCVLLCPAGLVDCRTGRCVDLAIEPDHCGDCGTVCAADESCEAGSCVDVCGDGLTSCGRQCVDVTGNPDHCGSCGLVCDTGICEDGECRAGAIGHLVAIGHDYTRTRRDQSRLVGNAVLVAQGAVEILTYDQYAAPETVANVVTAINDTATAASRSVTFRALADPQLLEEDLVDADVFLLYAQTSADADTLVALGELWNPALAAFLARGGVIVFVDALDDGGEGGTYQVLRAAGFLDVDGLVEVTGDELHVIGAGDSVATGMSASYRAEEQSVRFVTGEGNVVVSNDDGPVVIHKVFLP